MLALLMRSAHRCGCRRRSRYPINRRPAVGSFLSDERWRGAASTGGVDRSSASARLIPEHRRGGAALGLRSGSILSGRSTVALWLGVFFTRSAFHQ
jgi:hypothetical protein